MRGNYEGPDGWDMEREQADFDQADMEAQGRAHGKKVKRFQVLKAEGKLQEAAEACPHSGGYPLDSLAARNAGDPREGQSGIRCSDCQSVVSCFPWSGEPEVIHPCEDF